MTTYFEQGYNDILTKLSAGPGGPPTGPIVGKPKNMLTQTAPPKIQGRKPIPSGSLRTPGVAPAPGALTGKKPRFLGPAGPAGR